MDQWDRTVREEKEILLEGLSAEAPWVSRTAMTKKPIDPFEDGVFGGQAEDLGTDLGFPTQTATVSYLPNANDVFAHLVNKNDEVG